LLPCGYDNKRVRFKFRVRVKVMVRLRVKVRVMINEGFLITKMPMYFIVTVDKIISCLGVLLL
jgi:hypothetical protein